MTGILRSAINLKVGDLLSMLPQKVSQVDIIDNMVHIKFTPQIEYDIFRGKTIVLYPNDMLEIGYHSSYHSK